MPLQWMVILASKKGCHFRTNRKFLQRFYDGIGNLDAKLPFL